MSEKAFVDQLRHSAKKIDSHAFAWKTNDGFSLGMPDLVLVIFGHTYFIEAKSALLGGKNDIPILRHKFSGPQVSVLRQLQRAGATAFGIVQIASNDAYIIFPDKIPACGNFTCKELDQIGTMVTKNPRDKVWEIATWKNHLLCE